MVTTLVAEKKNSVPAGGQDELLLNQCKSYIFRHLHDKLTVETIAAEVHVHPNYLSSYFTVHEGVSLYQFILSEKINLARNMLIYSDYSYIEIANYLGFSSQSHLGALFRKKTGYTLKGYRDKFKATGF